MSRVVIVAAALALGAVNTGMAARIVSQPEGSYEVQLAEVLLPGSTAGSVIFKPCPDCDSTSMSLTAATTYTVNRSPVAFTEFAEAGAAFRAVNGGRSTAVYVFYDVETGRVNRLALDHFGG
jgi:hypothetical protein